MYRFIKNTFFVSVSMGFLFGVAFLSSLFIFATNSFAQQPLSAAVDNSLFGSYAPSAADATAKTTSTTTITNNTPTTAADAGKGNNDNQNQSILNKTVRLNHYENNELGVSLKYPSNFLIDESNSNNTLRQISFYPLSSAATTTADSSTTGSTTSTTSSPEQYILWMDVFVQKQETPQHPLLSLSNRLSSSLSSTPLIGKGNNNNNDLASYSLNLANSIQQANKDVSIIGSSSNITLSGYPAYELITKSFIGNTAIVDILVSTSVNNTVYSLDFQSNSSSYPNSISDTNKIIQSFKIISPLSLASNNGISSFSQPPVSPPSPSTSSQQQQQQQQQPQSGALHTKSSNSLLIPSLSSLLSDLQLNNVANNSTHILKSLKNSITNSVKDVLSNPQNAIDNSIKGTTSLIPTSPSELSSLSSGALKKACGLPFVSDVCSQIGNSVSNKDQNPNSTNKIVNNTNNGGNKTSSSNSIFNNEIINKDNGVAGNGTGVNATATGRNVGIGNGEDSIKSGSGSSVVRNVKLNNNSSPNSVGNNNSNSSSDISVNNKRNSLMAILDHLLNTNTNNSFNQSLSSNSSMLGGAGNGGGLSFLKKLLTMYFSFSSKTNNPHNISTAITPYSLNSSILSATTERANQSNSTVMPSSPNSSSSHSLSSLLAPSPSSYIPPPIH